jgi:membrane associated rhomboid family serine protease
MYAEDYPGDIPKKTGTNWIRQPATLHSNSLRSHTGNQKSSKPKQVVLPYKSNRVYPEGISKKEATRIRKYIPFVTILTLLTQIAMLSWALYQNGGVQSFFDNPFFGPTQSVTNAECFSDQIQIIVGLGAKDANSFYAGKQYHRVITPLFIHAGVFQFLITIMVSMTIGWTMERKYHGIRYGTVTLFV